MNLEFKKELPLIGIVLVPFVYLAVIWNNLPEKVPVHWNYNGQIDRWGEKYTLIIIVFLFTIFLYVLMLIIPKIDPKKRLEVMGGKFYQLKFILLLFFSGLALIIVNISKNESLSNPGLINTLIGFLFIVLGNYFKVIQPNYFIGIRTPWTLENKEVWKSTHAFSGKLWMLGGVIIVLSGLLLSNKLLKYSLISVMVIIVIVPILFSYFKFKQIKK
ncbi:SdpI family protein [Flavobacterium sp. CF136]|uniref:SdpI family protein n=1 Tax=Flavobacterium sp. (strain CF136) TaxID=1144313 RepID=UPI000271B8EC|nr:SdpI family protein [Flavobacterium sp. CF136]EJL65417.1 putative integral membrane protein [Flavobacterium sp. CF136]